MFMLTPCVFPFRFWESAGSGGLVRSIGRVGGLEHHDAIGLPEHRVGGPIWLPHGVRWVGGCSTLLALTEGVGGLNYLGAHIAGPS
jgi:hypothetical protein